MKLRQNAFNTHIDEDLFEARCLNEIWFVGTWATFDNTLTAQILLWPSPKFDRNGPGARARLSLSGVLSEVLSSVPESGRRTGLVHRREFL